MYKTRGGRRRMQDTRNPRNNPNTSTSNMGWHKIIIRDGCMYDKNEVLDNLKEYVEEPFVPILYEVEGNSLVFYLEDNGAAAKAITNVNRRVTMRNGSRLIICNNRSPPPNRPLSVQQQEKVMHIMSERYCLELKRLDLKNFHNAPSKYLFIYDNYFRQ
nr:nuclear RNA export factor 1-like [Penaeus vannamei]